VAALVAAFFVLRMMKKYSLLIFDFDGTLVDTAPDIAFHVNQTLKRYGLKERSLEEVIDAIGLGVHTLMKKLAPELEQSPARLESIANEFKEAYLANPVITSCPYPYVREMMDGPLKKTKKAVVTNKPQRLTVAILERLKLTPYFDVVIGGEADYPHKPDPASTHFTLNRLVTPPSEALFIGDSHVDFETANNTGLDFIWMDYGYDASLKGNALIRRLSSAKEWMTLV
jgi:phosphoglycolate phosphatase